jgi:hypothetical protein
MRYFDAAVGFSGHLAQEHVAIRPQPNAMQNGVEIEVANVRMNRKAPGRRG